MAGKPFSTALYNNDDNAKDQVVEWLKSQDYEAWVNPDQYGIDVLAHKDGQDYQFEVEVKHNWKGPRFQYGTLHYSDRKRKFLKTPANTAFVTLNHERTHALLVPGIVLSSAPTIIKDTIYTSNEKFIEVLTSQCELVEIPALEVAID
jgi:Holliday junction resolvase-like predicted endonuclease